MGSCRNNADEERLQNLKNKAVELKVDGDVEFYKNLMYRLVPLRKVSLSIAVGKVSLLPFIVSHLQLSFYFYYLYVLNIVKSFKWLKGITLFPSRGVSYFPLFYLFFERVS